MGNRIRGHVRANVVGYLALFVALGGTATAVTQLDPNSVRSSHIANGQVKSADIAVNAAGGSEVRESTLAPVPRAANAAALGGKPPSAFAAATPEPVNFVGDHDGPPFTPFEPHPLHRCSDTWYSDDNTVDPIATYWRSSPEYVPVGFFRDQAGVVHLQGVPEIRWECPPDYPYLRGFTGRPNNTDNLFTLPPGFRPAGTHAFINHGDPELNDTRVRADGVVVVRFNGHRGTIDGISFRCAPSGQNGCP